MIYHHQLSKEDQKRLDVLYDKLKHASELYSGYPASMNFDYTPLFRFLTMNVNNIGDPYDGSNYRVHTHDIEIDVIDFFAKLFHLKERHTGYVTSGGTEGNLYGLYVGSYHYPQAKIYYSENAHYSIEKIIRIIRAESIRVKALPNGEIDYDDLATHLQKNRRVPAIIMANIGTTMTGAIDDISKIKTHLADEKIIDHYIHCDAALHGCILPFVDNAPQFDFSVGIDSIAVSGHKFIGSPIPCGVALVKYRYLKHLTPKISYVKITDSTISGSRNGITPLFLWYAIKRFGEDGLRKLAVRCLTTTKNITEKMINRGIAAWYNPCSNIVVFPAPSKKFMRKWQIASSNGLAHFIVMPHHTEVFFDKIVSDFDDEDMALMSSSR